MDLAMVILTAMTVVVSVIALCFSLKASHKGNDLATAANELATTANTLTISANEMQKGQVEMQIRELISAARSRYEDKSLLMEDREITEICTAILASAHEDVLNAYDEACAKYIDGKVDRDRFKKLYHDEIRQLVTDDANKEQYLEPYTKFHATNKVFSEWYNLEK